MGIDIAELHAQALASTERIVRGVEPSQLDRPTPCEGWDVRALLQHVIAGNLWVPELVGGKTIEEVGDALDGDVVGDDPGASYAASAEGAAEAFRRPGALDAPVAVSYGPVPGHVYAGHRFVDVLVHGWDLAVATGQDTTLEPELVAGAEEVIAPQAELLTASGMFGQPADVPDSAGPQARLLARLGRQG